MTDLQPGYIQWHCSGEDEGPDVGVVLAIAPGVELWCGEISRDLHANAEPDVAAIGGDCGSWLVLYDENGAKVIGKVGYYEGRDLLDHLAAAIRASPDMETGCSDDQIFAHVSVETLRDAADSLANPK